MAKKDLKPIRSKDEAKEKGRKGGIASGLARREKKSLRQRLELLLDRELEDGKGQTADAISVALINRALVGDVRAFEVIRDTIGEKPSDSLNIAGDLSVTQILQERFNNVKKLR